MSDLLDYAEEAGLENLRFRLNNVETLAKESNNLLTMLLAGIGGSIAFLTQFLKSPDQSGLVLAVGILAIWFMSIDVLLILKCMKTRDLQVPTNEPMNLYTPDRDSTEIRVGELLNIQSRIEKAQQRNQYVARWLDTCRYLAISSPVVFVLGFSFWEYF